MASKGAILFVVSLAVAQAQTPSAGQQQQPSAEQRQKQQQQEQMKRAAETRQERGRQQQVRNMFVRGNVMLASGGVPAEPIRIKYVCGGQASETLSDSKGRFTVFVEPRREYDPQDGGRRSMVWSGPGGGGCTLAADAAGFRSNEITDGGTIILTPLGDMEGGSAISVTSLIAPKKAKDSFFRALKELGKGSTANRDKVMELLDKAVDEYPEYAAAWARLGQVKAESGDSQGAIVALEKSVQLDERYLLPYDALVRLYISKGDLDHATELTQFVLGINPVDAAMRWYQALCDYQSGRDDEAIALLAEIRMEPEAVGQFPKTHQIMGLIYIRRGQLGEAAAAYKRYLELDPNSQAAEGIEKQLAEWKSLGVL